MKKLFTLLCVALFAGSVWADAEPILTPLWEHSTAKGNLIEVKDSRNGLAYYDGELYLASRRHADTEVVIYDAVTGLPKMDGEAIEQLKQTPTIGMAWAGGDVAIDDNGAVYLVASNATAVVKWDSKTADPIDFAVFPVSGIWAFDVYVDVSGNGCIIGAPQNTSTVYYIPVVGNVAGASQELTLEKPLGGTPRVNIIDAKTFWIDGASILPTKITLNDDLKTIKEEKAIFTTLVNVGVNGVAQFEYEGKTYLVMGANSHAVFNDVPKHSAQLFELNTETLAVTPIGGYFPAEGLGGSIDASFIVEPVVNVTSEGAFIYLMAGMDGIAAYKFAIPVPKNVENPVISPASGSFEDEVEVTITCATEGAKIYYTDNGEDPTAASTEYTGAITLTEATTIKAIALLDGYTASAIVTAIYDVTTGIGEGTLAKTKVYPANDVIVVETELEGATVEVYNLQGQKVVTVIVSGNEEIAVAKGVYVVRIGREVFKVIL